VPIYVYVCTNKKCRNILEGVRPIGTDVIACPVCNRPAERKMTKEVTGRPVIK
jgi:putative FmdB family regulatory protein